jgi:hypothetical protein
MIKLDRSIQKAHLPSTVKQENEHAKEDKNQGPHLHDLRSGRAAGARLQLEGMTFRERILGKPIPIEQLLAGHGHHRAA